MRMLDLFCGRWGWGKAFAARGWEVVGVDLVRPDNTIPPLVFIEADVLDLDVNSLTKIGGFDFVCASSVCDGFASFGMKHFRPNPPYPEYEIKLFNHTREICEASGLPYVIENVRAAQEFVGPAVNHAGSFYLWGNGVPPLLPRVHKAKWYTREGKPGNFAIELNLPKSERKPLLATIPPELAGCVADYATRICTEALAKS